MVSSVALSYLPREWQNRLREGADVAGRVERHDVTKSVAAICGATALLLLSALPALAASSRPAPGGPLGNDVSFPQCGGRLPTVSSFAIVGVNDGLANTTNPCLSQELRWASGASGISAQPKASLYVNTGNPGNLGVLDWPVNNIDPASQVIVVDPYGACTGMDTQSCAWQYGWNMADFDAQRRGVLDPSRYMWWLDVETGNSWETNTANNMADLEGMVAYFRSIGAATGVYSTGLQWARVAGAVPKGSSLSGMESWIPGAESWEGAMANCGVAPLTARGTVTVTQWEPKKGIDGDYWCTNVAHEGSAGKIAE